MTPVTSFLGLRLILFLVSLIQLFSLRSALVPSSHFFVPQIEPGSSPPNQVGYLATEGTCHNYASCHGEASQTETHVRPAQRPSAKLVNTSTVPAARVQLKTTKPCAEALASSERSARRRPMAPTALVRSHFYGSNKEGK